MSLKTNILANVVSQGYVAIVTILMVPLYVRYVGVEAYGLVGFYGVLQSWFQLLDMGFAPTMARETARFRGGAASAASLWRLLRTLEFIFISLAVFGCTTLIVESGFIANRWLKVELLPLQEVQRSIKVIAVIVALRWVSGLYRGAINGFESLVWLGGFNAVIATARFVLVIPVFNYVGTSPSDFFSYQLAVAVVELVFLVTQTYRLMPKMESGMWIRSNWGSLRGVLKFSLSVAFSSSVWVLVTQTDKLVLSKLLPLRDYAYFILAVMVANGVIVVTGPISGALLPRVTKLNAQGDDTTLIRLYRNATQLVGVIAIPTALVLAFFAEQVLWAWTGDAKIVSMAAPVLRLYALGNGILALGAFPYHLQFAKGDLKLHVIGSALFVVSFIPALVWATSRHGVTGAGYAWLGANVSYFFLWVPIVHKRFADGLHSQWLRRDIGAILSVTVVGAILAHSFVQWPRERITVGIGIAVVSLALLTIAAAGSSWVRESISLRLRARIAE